MLRVAMFKEIKDKVLEKIKDSNVEQIDTDTNNKNVGIYMLYIDNFQDDKIIPIYIGQTGCGKNRNFQNRYNEHLQELMALNRLRYDYYRELFFKNFYNGHYKTCKIFKYMVDHECTLKDFHMLVLEIVDNNLDEKKLSKLLDEKEQHYFQEFLPAFFGFNQINTCVQLNIDAKKLGAGKFSDKLVQYDLEDCENFLKYFGYGYTEFNYYYSYPKTPAIGDFAAKKLIPDLITKKKLLYDKCFDNNRLDKYEVEKSILDEKDKKYIKNLNDQEVAWETKFKPLILKWCKENKIPTNRFQKISDILRFSNEKEKIEELEKYLKKKKVNNSIIDIVNNKKEISLWRKRYIDLFYERKQFLLEQYECQHPETTEDLRKIFPKKHYDVVPLKDRYKNFKFRKLNNNELFINFEFSNNGKGNSPCDIIKIDFKFENNNQIVERKNVFINPQHEYEHDYWGYYEKSAVEYDYIPLSKVPFSVRNFGCYISTTMELKNGINEYTLLNKKKVYLNDVLDYINTLINSDTSVIVNLRRGMKNECLSLLDNYYKTNNDIKNKILHFLK